MTAQKYYFYVLLSKIAKHFKKYKGYCEECVFHILVDGQSIYPYYGVPPHIHDISSGFIVMSTRMLDKSEYPDNFVEDQEGDCGLWYCGTKWCKNSKYNYKWSN